MKFVNQTYAALYLVIITSLLALLSSIFIDRVWLLNFVDEGQFIENLTLFFYLATALFALFYPNRTISVTTKLAIAIIMIAMLAREADLHKAFGMSMLKIKFWLTDDITLFVKLKAAIILLCLAFSLYILVKKSIKNFKQDFLHKQSYAITLAIFFIILVVSKIIDRSVNMIYEMTGWLAPDWVISIQLPQEEYLECLLPLLIILAIIQYKHLALKPKTN